MQTGVFRTNCMDCLDRTNVVQGMLSFKALLYQLKNLGIMDVPEESLACILPFDMWTKNCLLPPVLAHTKQTHTAPHTPA